MKAPALFPLLLLLGLLSSCAMSTRQSPGKFQAVIHTQDELYEHLHGTINSWPEKNHYLGTTKDGFHIVRTSYPPWWMFQPAKTIAIRQEVLPQWHPRPYPLPRTRWLPVPWIVFCPSHPVPPQVQRQREKKQRELRAQLQATHLRPMSPPWPVFEAPLIRSKSTPRPGSPAPIYVLSNSAIDHLLSQESSPGDAACQMREPDAEDLRQRDALIQAR